MSNEQPPVASNNAMSTDSPDAPRGYQEMTEAVVTSPERNSERNIYFNQVQPEKYPLNRITTAKYNFITFLPKFLFEQFRKYANIFFLIVALIQQIPNVSPTGRYTTAVPLMCILTISAIKEIIEDFKRHKADDETNNSKIKVLRDRQWQEITWADIAVGDFVLVEDKSYFPADVILLASSEPKGICYIETANLDGETNLKVRQALEETWHLAEGDPSDLSKLLELSGDIVSELPNANLHKFNGSLRIHNMEPKSLSLDQLLLRGTCLKKTRYIVGVVIYTGHESKVMKNSKTAPLKRSTVEKMTNNYTLFLFGILLFMTLFTSIANVVWTNTRGEAMSYLKFGNGPDRHVAFMIITSFIMYHTIIPISLQVTLEMVRFTQAFFINWDMDMYDEESDTPAMARTSNLNEELGQVNYIFSDKTGTLTRNIMEFKMASVGGVMFGDPSDMTPGHREISAALANPKHEVHEELEEFFTAMAVCHTVIPETDEHGQVVEIQASSPDEHALVTAATLFGYKFFERTPNGLKISVDGEVQAFEILSTLDFTSARKRMSVVVRCPDGHIKLMIKGADSVILSRLDSTKENYEEVTLSHLDAFACCGLRTLCYAVADLSDAQFKAWNIEYQQACNAINNREELVEAAAEKIEQNLRLIGSTAIEDKLQEGVPETIDNLLRANIKIWVLTGDKQETAINIGCSCKLLDDMQDRIIINSMTLDETYEELRKSVEEMGPKDTRGDLDLALVIDGFALTHALNEQCRGLFLELSLACRAVVCCRVSPKQKADVVKAVRGQLPATVTLAIGDGANDVSMIQEAHIGVGLSGHEGLQAACASDYAIAQFRYLNKLILVHGAWNYHRLTKLILYSFYKNICLYVIGLWFAFCSGYSGQIVFDRWTLGLYNVIFTAAPPMTLGLFDRSCSAENCIKYPQLYKETQSSTSFNFKVFLSWVLNSVVHSIILFWFSVLATKEDNYFVNGQVGSLFVLGNMVYTYVVVTVCLKAALEHTAWTWLSHLAIWGSIASWFIFFIPYTHLWPTLPIAPEMVGLDRALFNSWTFWFGLFIIPVMALSRDFAWKALKRTLFLGVRERVAQMERANQDPTHFMTRITKKSRQLSERVGLLRRTIFSRGDAQPGTAQRTGRISRRMTEVGEEEDRDHGFAFSQEENGVILQSEITRMYDTRQRHTTLSSVDIQPQAVNQDAAARSTATIAVDRSDYHYTSTPPPRPL